MGEDREQDTVHSRDVWKDVHRSGVSSDPSVAAFDGVRGAYLVEDIADLVRPAALDRLTGGNVEKTVW